MPSIPPKMPSRRPIAALRPEELLTELEQQLTRPDAVLELLIQGLVKERDEGTLFDMLHRAAERDAKLADLATAYEQLAQDRRVRALPATAQVTLLNHAATFFADVFGDIQSALDYGERALAASPRDEALFARIEGWTKQLGRSGRLARACLLVAKAHTEEEQRRPWLERAAALVDATDEDAATSADWLEQLLRLDPSLSRAQIALEERLWQAGRWRDAARRMEGRLSDGAVPDEQMVRVRERLLGLYGSELRDPQRQMVHVEALLKLQPGHQGAQQAAEALCSHALIASRALAALSDAHEQLGQKERAASLLTQELKTARGPRRQEVQRRLAILRQDCLNDPLGALELFAAVLHSDFSDDEARERYVQLSLALDRAADAARLLGRALHMAKDPAVRSRLGVDLGLIQLRTGEARKARATFEEVCKSQTDPRATLRAASALVEIYAESNEVSAEAQVLEIAVRLETDGARRQRAARRLAELCEGELNDTARAVVAWRALEDSDEADAVLGKLQRYYEDMQDLGELSRVLAVQARRGSDPEVRCRLDIRATELKARLLSDHSEAIAAWQAIIDEYGPVAGAVDPLLSLLESEGRMLEVARLLEQRLALAQGTERASYLARLGRLRREVLEDSPGAVDCHRQALAIDPKERTSRTELAQLMEMAAHRAEVVAILQPIVSQEPPSLISVQVLVARSESGADPAEAVASLIEAAGLAEDPLGQPELAYRLVARAIKLALDGRQPIDPGWVELCRSTAGRVPPRERAELLLEALGDRDIDTAPLRALALLVADAQSELGQPAQAIELLRRGLQKEPTSPELLERIDDLMAAQATPAERQALFEEALVREERTDRRRDLLVRLATLYRRDLQDNQRALKTWQQVVALDGEYLPAHEALVTLHLENGDPEAAAAELQRALGWLEREPRRRALDQLADVEAERGEFKSALDYALQAMQMVSADDQRIQRTEQLARQAGDLEVLERLLGERLRRASLPAPRIDVLESIGQMRALSNASSLAADAYTEAARQAEAIGELPRAIELLVVAIDQAPTDGQRVVSLLELCAKGACFAQALPSVERWLVATEDDREVVHRLAEVAKRRMAASDPRGFAELAQGIGERLRNDARQRQLGLIRAQVLAAEPPCALAAQAYRELVERYGAMDAEIVDGYLSLLQRAAVDNEWRQRWQWLADERLKVTGDPAGVLAEWAGVLEHRFSDAAAAAALYERVVGTEPERMDAWSELLRLRRQASDLEGTQQALAVLARHADETSRRVLVLEQARLLCNELRRPQEAIDAVEPLLRSQPADPEALDVVRVALCQQSTRAPAADLLERAAMAMDDPMLRAEILETLLQATSGGEDFREARGRWAVVILESKKEQPEFCLEFALRMATELPGELGLWDMAEQTARRIAQPAPVVQAYEQALGLSLDPELAEEIARRWVDFHEEWAEDPDQVVTLLTRVLSVCPKAQWAFDRLKLAFNAAGRWVELFDMYDRMLEQTGEVAARLELLREAAMAAKDFANDADRAIRYFVQLDEQAPGDVRVEAAIERLYERQGMTRPLIDLLSRQMARAVGDELHQIRARVVGLWLEIDEPLPAFDLLQKMVGERMSAPETIQLLERLVALNASRDSVPPISARNKKEEKKRKGRPFTVRDRAATTLRKYYESVGQTQDVVRMLEIEVEHALDPKDRIERLKRIVSLRLEELDDAAGAFENTLTLVSLEPASVPLRQSLGELAERTSNRDRQARLLIDISERQSDPNLAIQLRLEAAHICEVNLLDAPQAIQLYQGVLSAAASDREAALQAGRALDKLLALEKHPKERVVVLETLADLEQSAPARRVALGEAARVSLDELLDPARAVRAWRQRLRDDAGDSVARDGLIVALDRLQDLEALIEALEERAARAEVPLLARADRGRIAQLYEKLPDGRDQAVLAWQRLRKLHGRDPESFDALVRLLEDGQRYQDLAELLDQESLACEGEPRRVLRTRLGELYVSKIGDVRAGLRAFTAAEQWERAMEVVREARGDRELALEVSRDLFTLASEAWTTPVLPATSAPAKATRWAINELAARLKEAREFEQVVDVLLTGAQLPFEVPDRRALRKDAALICADALKDRPRAIAILESLFGEDASDEQAAAAVTSFAILLEQAGRKEDVIALWERQAEVRLAGGDRMASAALWMRSAELAEQWLNDIPRAMADYARGADLGLEGAMEALARLHTDRDEPLLAAKVLERLYSQSAPESLGERALRLAQAYTSAGRTDLARGRLEHASSHALDVGPVRARLIEIYEQEAANTELAELCVLEAARAVDPQERFAMLDRAATVHIERRSEPAAAVPCLEQAVALRPDEAPLRLRLAAALVGAAQPARAVAVLKEQVERYAGRRPKERAVVHLALARAHLELSDKRQALEELQTANRIDPAHPAILGQLARLSLDLDELERAEQTYRALLLVLGRHVDGEAPSRAEALLDLSEIAQRRQDAQRAAESVESAFEAALEAPQEHAALERGLRQRQRYDLLSRAIEDRLARAERPSDAARALSDLVALHAENLGDLSTVQERLLGRARDVERQLEASTGAEDAVWIALGRAYEQLGDTAAEGRILECRVRAWLDGSQPVVDPEPLYRMAPARLADRARRDEGVALLARATEVRSDFPRLLGHLGPVLNEDPEYESALELLEAAARASRRADFLVEALSRRLSSQKATPELYAESLRLAQSVDDDATTDRLLETAVVEPLRAKLPPSVRSDAELALAERLEKKGEMLRALDLKERAAKGRDPEIRRALLMGVAQVAFEQLGDRRRAARLLFALHSEAPEDRSLWEPLLAHLHALGDSEQESDVLSRTLEVIVEPTDRCRLRLAQAQLAIDKGDDRGAARELKLLLREDSHQSEAALLLSGILERGGRRAELAELLSTQLSDAQERKDTAAVTRLASRIAELHEADNNLPAALASWETVAQWSPSDGSAYQAIERIAQALNDHATAADALERWMAVLRGPAVLDVTDRLVRLRRYLGDELGVARALRMGFDACPSDPVLRERVLSGCSAQGDDRGIAETLGRAAAACPDDLELQLRWAVALRDAGQPEQSLAALDQVLASHPEHAGLHRERGGILTALGQFEEAIEELESTDVTTTDGALALLTAVRAAGHAASGDRKLTLGLREVELLDRLGRNTEALNCLEALGAHFPSDPRVLTAKARCARAAGDLTAAVDAYLDLAEVLNGDELVTVALELVESCATLGVIERSRAALERALAFQPDHSQVRSRLADVYRALGARRELSELLLVSARAESDPVARQTQLLQIAELLLGQDGDPDAAQRILEEAKELGADNVEVVALLARLRFRSGNTEEALEILNEAIAAHRGRRSKALSRIYREMSNIQLEDGFLTDAMDSLAKASEMDVRNGALAAALGRLAMEIDETEVALRAFGRVALMKVVEDDHGEGATRGDRAHANYVLAIAARDQGDARKARMLVQRALTDDPGHAQARALAAELS